MSLELTHMGAPRFEALESVNQPSEGHFWAGVAAGAAVGLILLACSS
jgi:hypothetical protein